MDALCEPMEPSEALTGFLFGNIDEKGHLVEDVLDEESKRHLAGLSSLSGLASLVEELNNEEEPRDAEESSGDDASGGAKSPTAVDYSDITEVIDEEDERPTSADLIPAGATDAADSTAVDDVRDSELMPPPSWVSRSSASQRTSNDDSAAQSEIDKKYYAPLADMLPAECRGVDVREIFPEFRPGEVLRFSRLFKPQHVPSFYKKKKRRKGDDGEPKDEAATYPSSKRKALELDWGRPPGPDDILPDEEILMKMPPKGRRPDQSAHADDSSDGATDDRGHRDPFGGSGLPSEEWRYGPAQFWYDMYNVPETGDSYDLGFKLRERSSSECGKEIISSSDTSPDVAGLAGALPPPTIPDEAYLMVSQMHWENDVIWNGDEVKQHVVVHQWQAAAAAGWLPNNTIRTVQQFQQACRTAVAIGATKVPALAGMPGSLAYSGSGSSSRVAFKLPDDGEDGTGFSGSGNGSEFYSLFPIDSTDLIYGVWERQIIWDPEAMDELPQPAVLSLDPNDDNIILEIPEDKEPSAAGRSDSNEAAGKMEKEKRRSRLFMEKAGLIKEKEEEEDEPDVSLKKDPFNLSNDEYYNPRLATDHALRTNLGGNLIQHSTPAVDLCQPFFPTHMGAMKLRTFHRPPLKRYSHGPMSQPGPKPVLSLNKQIKRKAKMRDQERLAAGGGDGDIFTMRTCADLTACDGDVILSEYSEEYPPLLMQVGMATKIKNYYRRKPGTDNKPPQFKYGELAYAHHSPFLGTLQLGQSVPAFENNMFRAPVYMHDMPHTDFLIIRTRQSFHIRRVDDIFCVGQECPLMEVPGPNSKRANVFVRDFLQGFIYRLFWKSTDAPKRIKMEDIKKAFPSHSESSIRKRLKLCADFKRTGMDSNWWVIKSEFRLPSEDEIRAMVSPEQCCAYYSMLAAEQRLKDAGYGEKSLFAPEADEEDEQKIDDEVKTAPWNTTRAYISAMKGKCLLSLRGDADPTGCGEGFAYVRVPNKPQVKGAAGASAAGGAADDSARKEEKRTVTGTDADLRRLNLKDAKNLLREFGVPEAEIKKLSRWEVIDVVRTMSTQQAKMGDEAAMTKFARGNRFSIAEHQERYKEDCQRIFELQNKILSNTEQLSTEEESDDSAQDSDFEEMGKNIESMLSNKKTSMQLSKEREEAERKELHKMLMGSSSTDDRSWDGKRKTDRRGRRDEDHTDDETSEGSANRKLIITRTFKNEMGHEYTRTETVSKAPVIEAYLRIRTTKDSAFIQQFASIDDQAKEEMKRERRRIQEQLRRIKRNQEKQKNEPSDLASKKKKKENAKQISLKCGACGAVGHMRTNKECPLYSALAAAAGGGSNAGLPSSTIRQLSSDAGGGLSSVGVSAGGPGSGLTVAPSVEEEEQLEQKLLPHDDNLIRVEGTKVKFTKQLVEHAEKVKRETLRLKFPRHLPAASAGSGGGGGPESAATGRGQGADGGGSGRSKRRRAGTVLHCDYLSKPTKSAHRRRADPQVSLSSIFEYIINDMKDLPNTLPFHLPVNAKEVSDYYTLIKNPMDLQTLKQNVRDRKYGSREEFLIDVSRIVENSKLYNGAKSVYTVTAQSMLDLCLKRFAEKEEKLMRLEKAINPLLDDNDQVALSYIFDQIVKSLKAIDNSWPFHQPVNKKQLKDYYQIIASPMDLQTLETNVGRHVYHNHNEFLADVELIEKNSVAYNGPDSPFSQTAHTIVIACRRALAENEVQIAELEQGIQQTQEAAMDGIESESAVSGGGGGASIADDIDDEYSNMDDEGARRHRAAPLQRRRSRPAAAARGDEDDDEDEEYGTTGAIEGSMGDSDYYDRRLRGSGDADDEDYVVDVCDSYENYATEASTAETGTREDDEMESTLQPYEAEPSGSSPAAVDEEEEEGEERQLLVTDLHVTPENSGDEDEHVVDDSLPQQDYGDANASYQDDDSFDPNEFFRNAHFNADATEQAAAADAAICDDLQVSESSNEEGDENDENQGFSLDDFFQK